MYTNRFLVLLSFMFVLLQANAQTDQKLTPPPVHEHKVYEDVENNKIFWPMDMPVWVSLSPGSDKNSPRFLLDNVYENGKSKPLGEGIKLELSGNQFIRWVNNVTMGETKLRFFADGDAPIISHKFVGAPIYKSKTTVFYGKGLQCEISAKDPLSGVHDVFSSTDGQAFVSYKTPLILDQEKSYNIRYYAVDKTGYANKPAQREFIVDLSAPVTKHTTETNFIENTLSSQTTIALTSIDKLAGVKQIYYKFDNNEYRLYTGKLRTTGLTNGEHTLSYYAVDKVENKEEAVVYNFYYDKQPPKPVLTVTGDKHITNDNFYVATTSLINFSSTDDKIGTKQIYYLINSDRRYFHYQNAFPLSLKNGPFSVSFYAEDKLGNASVKKKRRFMMDLIAPTTTYKVIGARYAQRSTVWINKDTKIQLSATDNASGVKQIDYIVGGNPVQPYEKKEIQIAAEGNYMFRYYSKDNVGNREGDNVLLLIVDNQAPTIEQIFSVSPVGKKSLGGKELNVYPQYSTLFLAATDMSSGLKGVWYSVNGGATKRYANSIQCNKVGKYVIKIHAEDNLGQRAETEVVFFVKKLD